MKLCPSIFSKASNPTRFQNLKVQCTKYYVPLIFLLASNFIILLKWGIKNYRKNVVIHLKCYKKLLITYSRSFLHMVKLCEIANGWVLNLLKNIFIVHTIYLVFMCKRVIYLIFFSLCLLRKGGIVGIIHFLP